MVERPRIDFCWEGRLASTIALCVILWIFTALRIKALRGITYSKFSPRGVSGACIVLLTALCTGYTCVVIWNYTVWYKMRALHQQARAEKNDELVAVLKEMFPDNRKLVSFTLRMVLVTVLWLVKLSFVLVYYEFSKQLPRKTRAFLNLTTIAIVVSYGGAWAATLMDFQAAMKRESYSPAAGAGITLFIPPNRWSEFRRSPGGQTDISTLLIAELVISSLNLATDLMLVSIVYFIFRHLNLSRQRGQFRAASLMTALFSTGLIIAIVRVALLISGMEILWTRLAFDALTDFEAFVMGCAASIPAIRVLIRDGHGRKPMFGFADGWGSLRKSGGSSSSSSKPSCKQIASTPGSRHQDADEWINSLVRSGAVTGLAPVVSKKATDEFPMMFEELTWEEMAEQGIR